MSDARLTFSGYWLVTGGAPDSPAQVAKVVPALSRDEALHLGWRVLGPYPILRADALHLGPDPVESSGRKAGA